ncbi:ABC transporter permease [Acidicapsa ligni]|uniref:ABC transporter permease n=1 Tax=Acidicapsa ligni TaxID=542300 RepID=UPI0021E0C95C|nr:ABC transporter permease [Acidicapsa ligni]
MNVLQNLITGLKSLIQKPRIDSELDEELDSYMAASAAHKQHSGMSPEAATRAAKIEMGSRNSVKHQVWSSRWESFADNFLQDVRLGVRGLIKSPGFTSVALLSLTLGIGANTAIFTLMNAIMLRPLPVQNPQQLVLFGDGRAEGSTNDLPDGTWRLFSYPFFREFSSKTDAFSGVAAINSMPFGLYASVAGNALEPVNIDLVSGSYFSVLGVPPFLGRTISTADDQAPGGGPVVVANYAWFQRKFNGDPAAVGKLIRIQSHDYTLIGVAQPGFFGTNVGRSPDLWIPLSMEKEISPGWNGIGDKFFQSLDILARLKPGVSTPQASASTNLLFKQILRSDYVGANPSQKELASIQHANIELTSAANGLSGLRLTFSLPLKILMTIVGLVLLIACANIANMLLARGVTRAREVAVRMALGASRRRIVLQLLTESSLIAFTGAALGITLAWKASPILLHMAMPGPAPVPVNLTPDLPVLAFTLALTVLTALLFGTLPALKATRLALTPALKEGRGGGTASTRSILAQSLIVGQIALSVLLLASAGLFLRSLTNLTSIDTGFNKQNALLFSLDASAANLPHGSPEEIRSVQLQEQIESRVLAIPGVQSDSFSLFTFNNGSWTENATFQGIPNTPENRHDVFLNNVGNGYFATMGLTIQAGREFSSHDTQTSPKVAVINQTMAHLFFPDGSAVGHHFVLGDDPADPEEIEVIGIVKDAKYTSLGRSGQMAAYFPCTQRVGFYGNFTVRYAGDPGPIITAVRQIVAQANPNILVSGVSTLKEQVANSIATQSLIAQLSAFFGSLAVFLACLGIYGLMSYSVVRRTNEIGIRRALGAQTRTLLWMILRESVILLAFGLALGMPIALASAGILTKLLYQLSPTDPWTFATCAVIVAAMTLLAAWLPARRATKVDPIVALRCD